MTRSGPAVIPVLFLMLVPLSALAQEPPKAGETKKDALPTLSGWVLAAEDSKPLQGVTVTAAFRDSPKRLTATTDEKGYYEFKDVPTNDVVNVMRFVYPGRNHGLESKLSTSPGPARPNTVNKVLSLPTEVFTFDAYLGQFGTYSFLYHLDTGEEVPEAEIVRRYGELILAMPHPDDAKQLPGLTDGQRATLRKVRQQVLELYGLAPKVAPAPPPVIVCPPPVVYYVPVYTRPSCCFGWRWCR